MGMDIEKCHSRFKYNMVFFAQGEAAAEAFRLLNLPGIEGLNEAMAYMLKNRIPELDGYSGAYAPWGKYDQTYHKGNYVMAWQPKKYISLTAVALEYVEPKYHFLYDESIKRYAVTIKTSFEVEGADKEAALEEAHKAFGDAYCHCMEIEIEEA